MPNNQITFELEYPCPNCDSTCVQEVNETGEPIGLPTVECEADSIACQNAYANGLHAAPLLAAWDEYREAAWDRYSNRTESASSDADMVERMRDARRYK